MNYSWKLKIYTAWDEVDDPAFLAQWQKWFNADQSANVFSHPVIIKTWTDCYRRFQDITPLYCVAESGNTVIFLPLVLWHRNWKNAKLWLIVPAGYSDYDYHDPVVAGISTTSLMDSFWDLIFNNVLGHEQYPADKIDITGIHFLGTQKSWIKEEACSFIDLKAFNNFEEYFTRLGKNLRKDIRRRTRMLEERGSLSIHVYNRNELEDALKVLGVFLEVHARKWPNAFKVPDFHKTLLLNGISAGFVHFSEMRLDDVPISWELGFRCRSNAYSYMPAYKEEYAKYSPGKVHLSSLIEDSFESGLQVFDFMRGSEEYKGEWADSKAFLYRYQHAKEGVQTRMKLFITNTIKEIKNFVHKSPLYAAISFCLENFLFPEIFAIISA